MADALAVEEETPEHTAAGPRPDLAKAKRKGRRRGRKSSAWESKALNLPGVKTDTRQLQPHKARKAKKSGATPGPGQYAGRPVEGFKGTRFGGRMANEDRGKTGAYEAVFRRSREPGPGAYSPGDTLQGRQASSRRPNTSAARFGSSGRDDGSKLYIPGVESQPSRWAPGPGAYRPKYDAVRKGTTRSFTFGGQGISRSMVNKSNNPNVSGSNYRVPGGLGKQPLSTHASQPTATFGKGTREKRQVICTPDIYEPISTNVTPAPGTYQLPPTTGKQVLSRCRSMPGVTFDRCDRMPTPGRAQSRVPDPGKYPTQQSVGIQFVSTKPSAPQFKFGTGGRS